MKKKMKWIGLEWRKRREIGEKSCPKSHFSENTQKPHFQKKRRHFPEEKKASAGIPLSLGEGVRGAGPGPNKNEIGQIWSK